MSRTTSSHVHYDFDDEMPPNAGIAEQSSSNTRIRAPRFIPWEPSKAATGPGPVSHRKSGRKLNEVKETRVLKHTPTPSGDLQRLYPSPNIVYHTHIRSNELGNIGVKSAGNIKTVHGMDELCVIKQEIDRDVFDETSDNESVKTTEKLRQAKQRTSTLLDDLSSEKNGKIVRKDKTVNSTDEIIGEVLKGTKPISVVDPLKIDDAPNIDINELESREIERLRRMNDKYNEKVKQIREERNELKKELEVQFQVNTELKKLLVASVGDDLQHRVERLVRERAQLANEISDYCKRIHDDHENIDSVSIQADMWRSKYIASRMMTDELNAAKLRLSAQYEESQHALQGILHERNQMRSHLTETYRYLHQVKESLQAHGTKKHIYTTNVIGLVDVIRSMAEAIKFRLIGNPASPPDVCVSADDYTQAEVMAMEILHSHKGLDDISNINPPSEQLIRGPIARFHPVTRYDQLTLNCCNHCNGEIVVV